MARKAKGDGGNTIALNRKARFNYHVEETFEAGIVLAGSEVKSLREGKANIAESYATEDNGELFIINAYIPEYQKAGKFNNQSSAPSPSPTSRA